MVFSWKRYPVTATLLAINICVFLVVSVLLSQPDMQATVYYWFVNIPGYFNPGVLLSHFVHFEIWHLFSNMYMLYVLGPVLERYVGKKTYIGLLIRSGLIASVMIRRFASAPTLGFSGIVLGMIAFIYFYKSIPVHRQQLGILLALNIVIGLSPGISFLGHAAGALGGFLYAQYLQSR